MANHAVSLRPFEACTQAVVVALSRWAACCCLVLLLLPALPLQAEPIDRSASVFPADPLEARVSPDTTEPAAPLVRRVRFEGNRVFSNGELLRRVRTRPNRRFLGIPGFTWWLWLYQLGDSGALGEHVGEALMASGESPARLESTTLDGDVERLRAFYRQEGFREAQIDVRVESVSRRYVDVVFRVAPGSSLYARYVRYDGLEQLDRERRQQIVQGSLLEPEAAVADTSLQFRASGQRYSESVLLEERQRILRFLRDDGYAAVTRDSIRALIFPQPADSFDVTFRVRTGPRYRMGDINLQVSGPEPGGPVRADTLVQRSAGTVAYRIEDERRLSARLLQRALTLEPGDWYDQSELLATKRRLESTGVFSFTDVTSLPADTVHLDGEEAHLLPHRISLQTRNRHLIRLESFMLQRTGLLSAEGEIGTGLGTTYENVNLLGGGEAFRVRGTGSVAASLETGLFTSAQAEVTTSLTYPYLIWPFRGARSAFGLYDARTQLSLSLLTARRENLRFILRGRGNARLRLEMRHTPTVSSLVDVFDVSLSNPDTLRGFQNILDQIIGPEESPIVRDPVQRAQIQEDYTQSQINSVLRYTFRSARVNPLRRDRGYSYEASAEVANTMPYLLDRYLVEPDTLRYRLPGLPLLGGDGRLLYRPYVRFVGDFRRYWPVQSGEVLALKLITGVAHPTGRPRLVPFDRRFYSGGASSVRGWNLRELRPHPETLSPGEEVPNILGGDVKLEASVELRSNLLRNVLAADWGVALFADAGNVWYGPRNPGVAEGRFRFDRFYRQLGLGAGTGLRVAWDYLILRFDVAHRVHDPLRPGAGAFPDGLTRPRLHFGIGQAF